VGEPADRRLRAEAAKLTGGLSPVALAAIGRDRQADRDKTRSAQDRAELTPIHAQSRAAPDLILRRVRGARLAPRTRPSLFPPSRIRAAGG
jgi:hypothetical protein